MFDETGRRSFRCFELGFYVFVTTLLVPIFLQVLGSIARDAGYHEAHQIIWIASFKFAAIGGMGVAFFVRLGHFFAGEERREVDCLWSMAEAHRDLPEDDGYFYSQ